MQGQKIIKSLVLIVLLIMSGILVTIGEILTAARTSRGTIHNIRETQLAGPAILDLIENDLRALYAFNLAEDGVLRITDRSVAGLDADRIDFIATTDSLVVTPGQDRYLRSDLNEVGYCLRPNPDDNDFLELYRREGFGVDDEPFNGGYYTFLHDRIVAFDIRVFEEDGIDAEEFESWGTDFDEFSGLPTRIEIDLVLELAPRLIREQLKIAPIHARTVVHRRVIRIPQTLRDAAQLRPVLVVPDIRPPQVQNEAGGAAADPDQPGGGGGRDGDDFDGGGDVEPIFGGGGGGGGGGGDLDIFGGGG